MSVHLCVTNLKHAKRIKQCSYNNNAISDILHYLLTIDVDIKSKVSASSESARSSYLDLNRIQELRVILKLASHFVRKKNYLMRTGHICSDQYYKIIIIIIEHY